MEGMLEQGGVWLARACALYGMGFLLPTTFFFLNLILLGIVVWAVALQPRARRPSPQAPSILRRWVRLAVEIVFGLINPVLYLAILTSALPELGSGAGWWLLPLTAIAWALLAAFWALRAFGAALDLNSRMVRAGIRTLLGAALACLLLYALKDYLGLSVTAPAKASLFTLALNVLRLCPLYLIPAILLWDYIRSTSSSSGRGNGFHGLFLLPGRSARAAVAVFAVIALVTFAVAAHRRSDASVRELVRGHRKSILAAAARYGVDPRLIASIVYVAHRDQVSPFRDALERLLISAWAANMRREFGLRPPDKMEVLGTDENPLLNRSLDISVGLAQIKPRTAQTASVLAMGVIPDQLPKPAFYSYRDIEPLGEGWNPQTGARTSLAAPIAVPAERHVVADALLDAESNLAMCALILALYQNQWETTNRAWSLRGHPDVLATLYQIGFARSKPHAAPRSNAFGRRVHRVYGQPWLGELFDGGDRSPL